MSKFDEIVLQEIFTRSPNNQRAVIYVIAESHKGQPHERALQQSLIRNAASGTAVVIESGSHGNSLEKVADMTRQRKDLSLTMADAPEEKIANLMAQKHFAEALCFEAGRNFFSCAYDQINKSPINQVMLFVGGGHLRGIDAAAQGLKDCIDMPMVNLATGGRMMRIVLGGMIKAHLLASGYGICGTRTESAQMLESYDFAFQSPRVQQFGPRLKKLAP